MSKELCFRLKVKKGFDVNSNDFIDNLIDFSIKNNVSFGGNPELGGCYCSEYEFDRIELRINFINEIKNKYKDEVLTIIFQVYNEQFDKFIDEEEISI